ncbi:hypothetical protein ABKN59_011357 [Abortiporus biennis]
MSAKSAVEPVLLTNTTLCLACSSTLPSRETQHPEFITLCCKKPICSTCLSNNPRLRRYNPCLKCLGGAAVVQAKSAPVTKTEFENRVNLDGGIEDQDVFVLEDEDEENEDLPDDSEERSLIGTGTLTPSSESSVSTSHPETPSELTETYSAPEASSSTSRTEKEEIPFNPVRAPLKYFIKPEDTLLGIALKYKLDGRLLCRLNSLPPSTLRTNPHLLHTRAFLIFPPSNNVQSVPEASRTDASSSISPVLVEDSVEQAALRARYERERAQKKFQTLTKERDYDVARAYLNLASSSSLTSLSGKEKEKVRSDAKTTQDIPRGECSIEGRAIDHYLSDEEWEENERREGRNVDIPKFPFFEPSQKANFKGKTSVTVATPSWWRWTKGT